MFSEHRSLECIDKYQDLFDVRFGSDEERKAEPDSGGGSAQFSSAEMGNIFSSRPSYPDMNALLFGLDAAGKTTILYKTKHPSVDVITTIPTIGFCVEQIEHATMKFTSWVGFILHLFSTRQGNLFYSGCGRRR